jgi:3-dehydroquinate synthase class II
MKELWLELDPSLSDEKKTKLLKSAAVFCDAVLVDTTDVETAKKVGVTVASVTEDGDISVLQSFNADATKKVKQSSKPVAVKIVIDGKKDE